MEKLPLISTKDLKEKADDEIDASDIVAIHRITEKMEVPRPIIVTFLQMEKNINYSRNIIVKFSKI